MIADDDWWAWKTDDQAWAYCQPSDFEDSDCVNMFGDGSWNGISCYLAADAYFVEYNHA